MSAELFPLLFPRLITFVFKAADQRGQWPTNDKHLVDDPVFLELHTDVGKIVTECPHYQRNNVNSCMFSLRKLK